MQTIGGDPIVVSAQLKAQREQALREAQAAGATWSVERWLHYLDSLCPEQMELGLERVRAVAQRMGLMTQLTELQPTIVTVAGTNGKGSTATLIARALGQFLPVGLFTSPHLLEFNERIELSGQPISDTALTAALTAVVTAQLPVAHDVSQYAGESIPLTYFEIVTLAAMAAFVAARCQVIMLEVGLGGRLDSTNIFAADIAVITSIGLDHMKILGHTTREIAREKAGIIKPGATVILGANIDDEARAMILAQAQSVGAPVQAEGVDFSAQLVEDQLEFKGPYGRMHFSLPQVPFGCAGPALAAITTLWERLPLPPLNEAYAALDHAVATTKLLGRMTLAPQVPKLYLDVAHNVPAAAHLVTHELPEHVAQPNAAWVVIGMLKDKDIEGVLATLQPHFTRFYVASLHTARGEQAQRLREALRHDGVNDSDIVAAATVAQALEQALLERGDQDLTIVVVGSFVTVAEAWQYLRHVSAHPTGSGAA